MSVKICHVTSAHKRYDDRIFEKECVSLAEEYEVHLLVNDQLGEETVKNVHIHSMNIFFRNRVERVLNYKKVLEAALYLDADIYHLHDPELLLIAKKLLKHNKKVIFDSHEYYYEQIKSKKYIPTILRSTIAFFYKKYETYICKRITGVISICPLREGNIVYDPFENRCKNHKYIANYPVFKNIEACINRDNDDFKVCYAGGLAHERGITHLIDACYKADCKLILAGTFSSDEYKEKLQQKESFKCVDYRGQCTTKEVFEIYEDASLGASTLLNCGQYFKIETFPVKVYEYFQMKLPVLISNYPYAVNMNKAHKFGVSVCPDNIDEMADAINLLKGDKQLCSELGSNGNTLYKEELNWLKESKKLLLFYKDIIEKG